MQVLYMLVILDLDFNWLLGVHSRYQLNSSKGWPVYKCALVLGWTFNLIWHLIYLNLSKKKKNMNYNKTFRSSMKCAEIGPSSRIYTFIGALVFAMYAVWFHYNQIDDFLGKKWKKLMVQYLFNTDVSRRLHPIYGPYFEIKCALNRVPLAINHLVL